MAKKVELDENGFRKVGFIDYLAYAAGDFGCNMSFVLAGTFFTLFYTQYMGIDSLTFAGILVILKIWDAINDPLIGGWMDSTKRTFKRGKFKTFIFYGSFLLVFSACMCFLPVPQANMAAKIALCVVGYMLWDASYTIVNVPYGSMLSVISANAADRAQLGAWRSVGAILAQLPVQAILPVIIYDHNNNLVGSKLFWVALVLGVIGLAAFQFMIHNTIERVQVPEQEKQEKFNYLAAIKNFFKNRPALGATIPPVAQFLGTMGGATAVAVMFQSYFQNARISGVLSLLTALPMFFFMPFLRKIVNRFGKKEAAEKGMIVSIIACLLMVVVPIPANGTGIAIFIFLQLINGIGMGLYMCVGNAMMADAIDYNEWKNGVRDEGVTYALHSFFRKLAQGIGPSIGLVLMVMLGYNEQLGAAQPFNVALNMRYLVGAMYLVSALLQYVGIKYVYNLDKDTLAQMERELGHATGEGK